MRMVRCPCCGHVFDADAPPLSADAQALLAHAPPAWRRGRHVGIRPLADLSGLNYHRARRALQELTRAGYAAAVPFGRRGRVRYLAVPTMLARNLTTAAWLE